VAKAIVALYHDAAAAAAAEESFDATFKRGEAPADLTELSLPEQNPVHLPALMVDAGLAESSSAARRSIDAGSVRLDGQQIAARHYDLDRAALAGAILTVGKRRGVHLR
jgi:tyrosyl-tRNA synthetase